MIGICAKCGNHVGRYSNMDDPCEICGCIDFWCFHASYEKSGTGIPDHWVLVDGKTKKSIGPDMCDNIGKWKYEPKIYLTVQ
jgi:hypothetical protein